MDVRCWHQHSQCIDFEDIFRLQINQVCGISRCQEHFITLLDTDCRFHTMTSMRTAKTVSITLPPDLLILAQAFAQREHRTMSELFREALRRYMARDGEWEALLARMRAKGEELGIKDETDVERLSDEFRREKRG